MVLRRFSDSIPMISWHSAIHCCALLRGLKLSAIDVFMGAPHTTTRAWESKKRKWNGNRMEWRWRKWEEKGNG